MIRNTAFAGIKKKYFIFMMRKGIIVYSRHYLMNKTVLLFTENMILSCCNC